ELFPVLLNRLLLSLRRVRKKALRATVLQGAKRNSRRLARKGEGQDARSRMRRLHVVNAHFEPDFTQLPGAIWNSS
ncbi:MAG: hypothetical protein ACNA75_10480, partial [Thiohalomonadaceae bacterium]